MSAQAAVKLESNESYDEVPYESFAYPSTHPSHVSTIATLFGMTPPDFRTANVLELGCASGGNILPLAVLYPKAKFTGIDLSGAQISLADKNKKDLKLDNVEFMQQDILKFAPKNKGEKYDYIICHGIFSWVPEPVREKIFGLCKDLLSPSGLAIISYNALPGWGAVRSLREMMLYHTNRFSKPEEKVQQARCLLDFLAESVPEGNAGYRAIIENERNMLKNVNSTYLYHDHLESENAQFYLHDFASMAKKHGLDYVGDTALSGMYVGNMPPKAAETLKLLNDVIAQEQYMDFVTNRRFHTTILCKEGLVINRNLKKEQVMDYYLSFNSALKITGSDPAQEISFTVNAGSFKTNDIVSGTLFLELAACGRKPVLAKELVARVQEKLKRNDFSVQNALIENGLHLALMGYIDIRSDSSPFVTEISQKPVAFPFARHEARANVNRTSLTNSLCVLVESNIASNLILQNLDGTKTHEDLVSVIVENIRKGVLKMDKDGKPVTDEKEILQSAPAIVNAVLQKMASCSMLTG